MSKNKKAFTLIEILGALVSLALIIFIIFLITSNILSKTKNEEHKELEEHKCFTYEEVNIIESFDINYDECLKIMSFMYTEEELELLCNGEEVYGISLKNSIMDSIIEGTSIYSNLITNAKEITGIKITGYDNTCGQENVILPKSIDGKDIIMIGSEAFGFNYLSDDENYINSKQKNYIINNIDMSNATELRYIGNYAFFNNKLVSVMMPDSIEYIGEYAFAENKLTSVAIPNSVITIGNHAFASNKLTSVAMPNSLITIGNHAFASNELTSVTIPDSVTTIGNLAFYKDSFSNSDLTTIINKTGISFYWGQIINGGLDSLSYEFETGIVKNEYGNVEIRN